MEQIDFTQPIMQDDGFPMIPCVEFTEDEWETIYTGGCIDKTHSSYLVRGYGYGTFWIPKAHVRLAGSTL